jgi:hypothetical protein
MTFILAPQTKFTAPVHFRVPADGGKTQKIAFSVVFKLLSADELADLQKRARDSNLKQLALIKQREQQSDLEHDPLPDPEFSNRDLIDEVLIGFGDDLLDVDRQPLAFTTENLERLLSVHGAEAAIIKSFYGHHIEAPQKN